MYKIDISYNTKFAFIFSFVFYFSLVFLGLYGLKMEKLNIKKYTDVKDSYVDIVVVQESRDEEISSPKKDQIKKETEITKEIKDEVQKESKTSNQDLVKSEIPDIKSLFSDVQLENINKKDSSVQSRKPQKEQKINQTSAKSILETLNKDTQTKSKKSAKIGEYNKFWGEISHIIESRWRVYQTNGDFEAIIVIVVDKFGKLSYNIKSLSSNTNFNQKVRDFMENLSDLNFPKPPEKMSIQQEFRLVDKIETMELK